MFIIESPNIPSLYPMDGTFRYYSQYATLNNGNSSGKVSKQLDALAYNADESLSVKIFLSRTLINQR